MDSEIVRYFMECGQTGREDCRLRFSNRAAERRKIAENAIRDAIKAEALAEVLELIDRFGLLSKSTGNTS